LCEAPKQEKDVPVSQLQISILDPSNGMDCLQRRSGRPVAAVADSEVVEAASHGPCHGSRVFDGRARGWPAFYLRDSKCVLQPIAMRY